MVATLTDRLKHLVDIGLEYLSLNRETDTLSGGESQRVKIVKNLSSSLTDVMYIFFSTDSIARTALLLTKMLFLSQIRPKNSVSDPWWQLRLNNI
jgi:ABC-type iron transport system FetAB ATPase subunit